MPTAGLHVAGTIRVPGDKSISHRSLIFAALAPGTSRVRNILNSADVRATARVLNALGASVPVMSADMVVQGIRPEQLHTPSIPLDCANSGTTSRLMIGVVSGLAGQHARFEGDESLSKRPMRRVAKPLVQMGARIEFDGAAGHEGLPLTVYGAHLGELVYHSEHARRADKRRDTARSFNGGRQGGSARAATVARSQRTHALGARCEA